MNQSCVFTVLVDLCDIQFRVSLLSPRIMALVSTHTTTEIDQWNACYNQTKPDIYLLGCVVIFPNIFERESFRGPYFMCSVEIPSKKRIMFIKQWFCKNWKKQHPIKSIIFVLFELSAEDALKCANYHFLNVGCLIGDKLPLMLRKI